MPLEMASASQPTARASIASSAAPAVATTGTDGDDVLFASAGGPYHFYGYAGHDDITGTRGGDVIDGGSGGDDMRGGAGNDTYYVDSDADHVIEDERGGFDRVISSIDYVLGAFVEHVALTGTARNATGNALRNTLEGNEHDNTLSGGDGDDTLAGNPGDDTLIGGAGGDGYVYEEGDGRDLIIDTPEQSGEGNVIILAGDLTVADVSFERAPSHLSDLVLSFRDGGSITIANYFSNVLPIFSEIQFLSGATWAAADIAARAASAAVTSNHRPIARDDSLVSTLAGSFILPVSALTANDADIDGDTLRIAGVSNAIGGTVVLNGDGSLNISPTSAAKAVTFDYAVTDDHGGNGNAHAFIALAENRAPVIAAHSLTAVSEDTIATGRLSATDADGDDLAYAVKPGGFPAKGRLSLSADGTFSYKPNANANGADHFTLTVTDGLSAPVEQTFNFNIAPVNDAPVARSDTGLKAILGTPLTIKPAALLANDTDVDGDALAIAGISGVSGGSVTRTASGDIVFKASGLQPASFAYTVTDGHGGSSTASVSIAVTAPAQSRELIGTERSDVLTGTNGPDVFNGKGASDILNGLAGNDTFKVNGDAGLDSIDGGAGTDTVLGGSGADIIRVNAGSSNFKSIEKIDGGAGFDKIVATSGRDVLDFSSYDLQRIETIDLGAGNDQVHGPKSADVFFGGAGHDTFVFRHGDGHDTILDFKPGYYFGTEGDRLDLRGCGIRGVFDLFSRMHQVGQDTLIKIDSTTDITLKHVSVSTLILSHYWII